MRHIRQKSTGRSLRRPTERLLLADLRQENTFCKQLLPDRATVPRFNSKDRGKLEQSHQRLRLGEPQDRRHPQRERLRCRVCAVEQPAVRRGANARGVGKLMQTAGLIRFRWNGPR